MEILFQGLIHAFGLSIAFWVVSGGEVEFHVQGFSQGAEKGGYELCTPIGGDMRWNSMLGKDMEHKQLGKYWSGYGVKGGDEYGLLGKAIHND
jgi:hypothetical protein